MTAFISPPPRLQFFTNAGVPMAGGFLYTYAAGTTTPLTTYTDSTGLVANTNPVILDSRGEASIWLSTVGYKFKLATPANVDVWTQDNITSYQFSSNLISYTPAGTGAVVTTVQAKLRESASVKDFGAVGDNSTNDTAAINLAIAALNAGQIKALYFPAGTYVCTGSLTTITKDGVTLYGDGPRLSVLSQTANVDTLTFSNVAPATNRINDIFLSNFGISYGAITAPTAGRALVLIRPGRSYISNFDIRSVYQGIDCQGGSGTHISNLAIAGAFTWSSVATGSFLLKFQQHAASLEIPSEIFVSGFNVKGSSPLYLSNAIIVQACDGLWFNTGHAGFSYNAGLYINPQAVATGYVINLEFVNVYFDGGDFPLTQTNPATSNILLQGSVVPTVTHISFIGCTFKNFRGNGFSAVQSNLTDLRVIGSEFSNNGGYGLICNGLQNLIVSNNFFKNNNGDNVSADCITLVGVVGGIVTGNQALSGTFAHAVGININVTCSDLVVQNNLVGSTHVLDFNCISVTRIQFGGNRKVGADPTVVAVDGFVLPLGYDVVTVTGNTNFSNIGNTIVPWNKVTLRFTGTPTAVDAAGNIKLAGNFVATADSTLTMMGVSSTVYTEVSRAIV